MNRSFWSNIYLSFISFLYKYDNLIRGTMKFKVKKRLICVIES